MAVPLLSLACKFPEHTVRAAARVTSRQQTAWQSCSTRASSAQFGPALNLAEQHDAPGRGRSADGAVPVAVVDAVDHHVSFQMGLAGRVDYTQIYDYLRPNPAADI